MTIVAIHSCDNLVTTIPGNSLKSTSTPALTSGCNSLKMLVDVVKCDCQWPDTEECHLLLSESSPEAAMDDESCGRASGEVAADCDFAKKYGMKMVVGRR
jgi:hypothetical protein